ncbi:MAG: carboxypeptidase-like regulatory domain-containing protein [Fidelibacterota bacterium]
MKKITLIFTIFSSFLTFSCEDVANDTPSFSGKVLEERTGIDYPIQGAVVSLKALSSNNTMLDTTDSFGEFKFSNLEKDFYNLRILHNSYESVDTVLKISGPREAWFSLKVDYYPLKLGNKWTYQVTNWGLWQDIYIPDVGYSLETYTKTGTEVWTIQSVDTSEEEIKFNFLTVFNGINVHRIFLLDSTDTTIINNYTMNLSIIQDKENILHFSEKITSLRFKRYYSGSENDTILGENTGGFALFLEKWELTKNVGLSDYQHRDGGNKVRNYFIKLVDYDLK